MTAPKRAVLVIGIGRSGTSLAMQALAKLGAVISEKVTAASDANPRGALEDAEVHERLVALNREFDLSRQRGLSPGDARPDDWRDNPHCRQAREWLPKHLAGCLARSPGVFAVKSPLASVFLPLWLEAFDEIGLDRRIVWATRRARDTIGSFRRAYGFAPEIAESRYLLRSYYIVQDMPADVFLLPYEGWLTEPEAQLRALAEVAGLPFGASAADGLIDPALNRGGSAAAEPPGPLALALDAVVSERRGLASDLFGPDLAPLRAAVAPIGDGLTPPAAAEGGPSMTMTDLDAQERSALAAGAEGAGGESEAARIAELERALLAAAAARDADAVAFAARLAEKDARIAQAREAEAARIERARKAEDKISELAQTAQKAQSEARQTQRRLEALEAARAAALARAEAAEAAARARDDAGRKIAALEEALFAAAAARDALQIRATMAPAEEVPAAAKPDQSAELARERKRLRKAEALLARRSYWAKRFRSEYHAQRRTARWRVGDMIVTAVAQPSLGRALGLPARLVAFWIAEARRDRARRRAAAAAQPSPSKTTRRKSGKRKASSAPR